MRADQGSKLTQEDKMVLLEAFAMFDEWLKVAGHDWTERERVVYESALAVIGPID